MSSRRVTLTIPCIALLLAVGCADGGSDGFYEGDSAEGGASASASGTAGATAPASSDGLYEGGEEGGSDPSAGDSAADSGDPGGGTGEEGGSEDSSGQGGEPGQLTAGEWRDLDHWQFWLDLLQKPEWSGMPARWGFATQQRYAVVVESDGAHVGDASVTLLAGEQAVWTARTDVHGEAELFAGMFDAAPEGPFSVKVSVAGQSTVVDEVVSGATSIVIPVEVAEAPAKVLDLMFVIDTTGSMGDELSYLQVELADVIDRVRTQVGADFKFRVSVNFYRDSGDEYLVRPFPFTENIDEALADLSKQTAGGGGDWPEAVDAALSDAIDEHAWSESAVARLCFVVLDAPPHDTTQALADVQASVEAAAVKGVRMVPLAASGVDKDLEFLMRFWAIGTGATYTFLTNDSGIGGDHIEPTVGDYQVEILNDLLVRVISAAVVDN